MSSRLQNNVNRKILRLGTTHLFLLLSARDHSSLVSDRLYVDLMSTDEAVVIDFDMVVGTILQDIMSRK